MKKTSFLICLLLLLTTDFYGQGFVVAYPQEPKALLSANYTVFVNEIPVSAYNIGDDRDVSYVHFAFAGKIKIRIHASSIVSTYNLSPHSYGIASAKAGQDITFELDRPRKLLLKEVNSLAEHLCIFADPLEDNPPKIGDANVVNIIDKGVDNTGATDNYAIIQAAIKSLPFNGILYFPPGRYTAGGDLQMKNNRSIYLAGGATLQASDTKELRLVFTGASNVKLFGRGSIDGRGDKFRPGYGGEGGNTILYNNGSSDNCRIDGIVLKNAITWTAIVMYTTNWTVYNMKIVNGKKYSNHDCWDPHDAVHMMMDDLFLYGTDDAIAYSILSPNLDLRTTIRNSTFYNGFSGATVRIGPWVKNGTKNITVENNDHLMCGNNEYSLAFYLGGSISGIKYLNNRVENAPHGLILIRTNWTDYYAGVQNGSADGILFDRLSVEKVGVGWEGHYSCFEGKNATNFVKNITFKDYFQKGVLQTGKSSADILFSGPYVTNVQFTNSATPVIDVTATDLFAYRAGSNPGKFTITRTGESALEALTVEYLIHGTAKNGTDYSTIQDSVTIQAGATSADILITADPTNTKEYFKTVFLSLSSSTKSKYMLGPGYHATVTILNGGITDIDNQPPTVPFNLKASSVTNSGFLLSWGPSTDNIGVATYAIYKNGIYNASTSDTTYAVGGLTASTEYEFTVKAYDSSGNSSALSNVLNVSTLATGISESYINQLSVYPNPVVDHTLLVDFKNAVQPREASIQIVNMNGKVEFQTTIPTVENATIHLPDSLVKGTYILSVKDGGISCTHKIVIK